MIYTLCVKEITNRPDLLTCIYTIKFLKLENHFADITLFQPLLLYNLEDLPTPVTSAYFHKTTNLLFLGLSSQSSGGVTGFLSKSLKLFSSNQGSDSNRGSVLIYNIIKNHQGASHFELLYEKSLPSSVSSINFYEGKNSLCVGMSSGQIALFKIYINESSSQTREMVEEAGVIKVHKKSVVGCCINFTIGYIYSVAHETSIKISELNYQSLMRDIPLTKKEITAMSYDETWGRMLIADDSGSLWIVDILTSPLQPRILQALHNQIPSITCLNPEFEHSLLLIGNKTGTIATYALENYNEKIIPQSYLPNSSPIVLRKIREINTEKKLKINCLKLNKKKELLVALSNGSIAVYSHDDNIPEFVVDSHLNEVVSLYYDDEKKILLTSSTDKTVKMNQLPIYWPGELMRKSQEKNKKKVLDVKGQNVKNANFSNNEQNSDEIIDNNAEIIDNLIEEGFISHVEGQEQSDDVQSAKLKALSDLEIFSEDLDGWDAEAE